MARLRDLTGVAADYTIGTLIVMGHFVAAGYRGRHEAARMPMRRATPRRERARDDQQDRAELVEARQH